MHRFTVPPPLTALRKGSRVPRSKHRALWGLGLTGGHSGGVFWETVQELTRSPASPESQPVGLAAVGLGQALSVRAHADPCLQGHDWRGCTAETGNALHRGRQVQATSWIVLRKMVLSNFSLVFVSRAETRREALESGSGGQGRSEHVGTSCRGPSGSVGVRGLLPGARSQGDIHYLSSDKETASLNSDYPKHSTCISGRCNFKIHDAK